jgi:hypothetical protein
MQPGSSFQRMEDISDNLPQGTATVNVAIEHLKALEDLASMGREMCGQNTVLLNKLTALEDRVAAREQLLPTPSTSPAPEPRPARQAIKAKPPVPFSGDKRDELETFLSQCRLYFLVSPDSFSTEQRKVFFAGSYLEGNAYSWFEPLLRIFEQHQASPAEILCPPELTSFAAFTAALITMFGDPDLERSKTRELKRLKQTSSVAVYASEFQRLRAYIGWNDKALYDRFYDGLRDNVKDDLARLEKRPVLLSELIRQAQQIDIRIVERLTERRENTNSSAPSTTRKSSLTPTSRPPPVTAVPTRHPSTVTTPQPPRPSTSNSQRIPQYSPFTPDGTIPMDLDIGLRPRSSGPRRLTLQDREYRMANNLCLFCGEGGHFKSQCPGKALSDQRRAQYALAAQHRLATTFIPAEPSTVEETGSNAPSENFSAQE